MFKHCYPPTEVEEEFPISQVHRADAALREIQLCDLVEGSMAEALCHKVLCQAPSQSVLGLRSL